MTSDSWDDFAADWDTDPDAREYAACAFSSWQRRVSPLISNLADIRVLDFGSGTGLLTEKFAPICRQVVAVDNSAQMIDVLDSKITEAGIDNVTSLVATVDDKSIADNQDLLSGFGLVVASSVCSFLPDFEATLCYIATTMNPGGVFVHWDWMDDMPSNTIQSTFSKAGMNCIAVEKEFEMKSTNGSKAVVMGIGQL
jgi:2-polyprenyl-3-methyl-5-hydroxy-6-metoxy-1,4-benzoquinol methylase